MCYINKVTFKFDIDRQIGVCWVGKKNMEGYSRHKTYSLKEKRFFKN